MLSVPAPSRRAFLTGAASLAGLAVSAIAIAPGATAATPSTAWTFRNTNHCHCRACRLHAANKVFATESTALAGRVHRGCQCTPVAFTIGSASYASLFTTVNSVDRRAPGIATKLMAAEARANPVATTESPTTVIPAAAVEAAVVAPSARPGTSPAPTPTTGNDVSTIAPPAVGPSATPSRTVESTSTNRSTGIDDRLIPASLLAAAATVGGLIWLRNRKSAEPHGPRHMAVEPTDTGE